MIVNVISESEYLPKGHGVHSAYTTMVDLLQSRKINVRINSVEKADIVHVHTLGPFVLFKLATSKPTVISAHVIPDSFIGSLIGARYWENAAGKYLNFVYNQADLVLAPSSYVKKKLQQIGVHKRIEVYPNPVKTDIFRTDNKLREEGRRLLNLSSDAVVVLGVGQVQSRKGVEDFIKIAKKFPQLEFVWIGGMPFKSLTAQGKIMKKLTNKETKNVLMPGEIPYTTMPLIYNASDIFLFPSFQETQGLCILEAAACGLPLLLRDLPEYKSLYDNNYLTALSNEQFTNLIQKLITDKSFYSIYTEKSKKLAQKFSYEALGDTLIKYYNELLQ